MNAPVRVTAQILVIPALISPRATFSNGTRRLATLALTPGLHTPAWAWLPPPTLKLRHHGDCTGDAHNVVNLNGSDGLCINTGCTVGSPGIAQAGRNPKGQVQTSYWEEADFQGKWFGYGYASRDQWKFLKWMR